MKNDNKASSSWKECLIFGIVNILLVILATKLNIMLISVAIILLIVAGVVVSAQYTRENMNEGYKLSAVGCVIGLLLHCGAGVLYVFNILMGFIGIFVH